MHSFEERMDVLESIMQTARQIALHDSSCSAGQAAWEYLQFCARHGYVGLPTSSSKQVSVGGYLLPGRDERPTTQDEARQSLGIVICFSDEVMPRDPWQKTSSDGITVTQSAYISPPDRLLVIGYVDCHTPVELALTLLHEARHARQEFGDQFENLPALDPAELHESRTWKYELELLDAFGGQVWRQAVQQEIVQLRRWYQARGRSFGEKYFAMSGQKYPALDDVFSVSPKQDRTGKRNVLLAMRANFLLAEQAQLPDLDAAYANIVGAYYDWSKRL